MKPIFDSLWRYIGDIFVEDILDITPHILLEKRDLTEYYRSDFPKIQLDQVLVGARYLDIQEALELYKYNSERVYVSYFVEILKVVLEKEDIKEYCIVTTPMHWSRYALRGFDHMDYLAKKLSKELDMPYVKPLKTRFSKRQSKLSRVKRLENRKNHFTIDDSIILPQKVLLIDDVISTGATAHECAKILKINGVERVIGVFIASSAEDLYKI